MGPCIGIRLGPHLNGYCHILTSPAFPTSTTFPPSPRLHISPHPKAALSPTPLPSQYRPPHAPYRPTKFDTMFPGRVRWDKMGETRSEVPNSIDFRRPM